MEETIAQRWNQTSRYLVQLLAYATGLECTAESAAAKVVQVQASMQSHLQSEPRAYQQLETALAPKHQVQAPEQSRAAEQNDR